MKLTLKKIYQIVKQIACAMVYLHSQKILHCDLKSQNILIAHDWTVKLCDFGLARFNSLAEGSGRIGTPHWMAPEIL